MSTNKKESALSTLSQSTSLLFDKTILFQTTRRVTKKCRLQNSGWFLGFSPLNKELGAAVCGPIIGAVISQMLGSIGVSGGLRDPS